MLWTKRQFICARLITELYGNFTEIIFLRITYLANKNIDAPFSQKYSFPEKNSSTYRFNSAIQTVTWYQNHFSSDYMGKKIYDFSDWSIFLLFFFSSKFVLKKCTLISQLTKSPEKNNHWFKSRESDFKLHGNRPSIVWVSSNIMSWNLIKQISKSNEKYLLESISFRK